MNPIRFHDLCANATHLVESFRAMVLLSAFIVAFTFSCQSRYQIPAGQKLTYHVNCSLIGQQQVCMCLSVYIRPPNNTLHQLLWIAITLLCYEKLFN